jgi:hypothetical protein
VDKPPDVPRWLRLTVLGVVALTALALFALGASAALDRPAKVVRLDATVDGPKRAVWAAITGFAAYEEWNPVITRARGEAREGSDLDLVLALPGHDPREFDAKVLIVRDGRKLRWQHRRILPGVEDWEYEIVLEPVGGGRVLVAQELRIEGLLAPCADGGAAQRALALEAEALAELLDDGG